MLFFKKGAPAKTKAAAKSNKPTAKAAAAAKAAPARSTKLRPVKAAPAPKVKTNHGVKQPTADDLKALDTGYQLAKQSAVKYLHSRRQAIFALARQFHVDADDLQQEAYEVLLTCLRDFNPLFTKADGATVSVQFNTFFGNRLEGKALEQRNRDPEYQARQAHTADMSPTDKADFRANPPLLVQHLDHESALQEHLQSEVSSAKRSNQTNVLLKIAQDSFIERKLNDLIAAERDDKRRAALQHVKVGGVASFDEIAYHFGVTDSRASQILNELMDAFYVQRLVDGDLKSIVYDFRKLNLHSKRGQRLLEEAVQFAAPERAAAIVEQFGPEYPTLRQVLSLVQGRSAQHHAVPTPAHPVPEQSHSLQHVAAAQLTAAEEEQFPLHSVEMRDLHSLTPLTIQFRPPSLVAPEALPHIRHYMAQWQGQPAENWPPLLITPAGEVIDGARRLAAAQAAGITRLMCQVRHASSTAAAQQLRVALNSRVRPLDKLELYFAIGALLPLGLTQGHIAQVLGTSRPNVIVYAKVREKATPRLRQLFEDGLIQITNASSAAELSPAAQDELADFIRQFGANWGRGPQFNELYEAAAEGQIATLAQAVAPTQPSSQLSSPVHLPPALPVAQAAGAGLSHTAQHALKKRQEMLEIALRDAEVWAKQREATITSQTAQIQELKQLQENLKRELEAQHLLAHGDAATIASYQKELKLFLAVQERLVASQFQLETALKHIRSMHLTHRQTIELDGLLEKIAAAHNALRVALIKTGAPAQPAGKTAPAGPERG